MDKAIKELIKAVVILYDEVRELKQPTELYQNIEIEEALLNANKALEENNWNI